MGATNKNAKRRLATRPLVIVVIALWIAVIALAGYYIWHAKAGDSASADTVAVVAATTTTAAPATTTTTLPPTTTTAAPTTTTTTEPPPLTVAAGGDVMGDRGVGDYIDKYGGESVFEFVKPYLAPADMAFVNLEGSISDKGSPVASKKYTFRARPALATGLAWAGVDVVSLANNHAVDYGSKALLDCIARLDDAGVDHAGAGADAAAAAAAAMLDTPAGRVAVLAASEITQYFAATARQPGTNVTSSPNSSLIAQVAAAAKQADFVVVSLHWGTEYHATADQGQRNLAHKLIDAGADLILGHHPHVIQGLEIYKDRLIAYSLGDFIFDHYSRATGETFVLQVTLPQEGPPSGTIIPVYVHDTRGVPKVVTGSEANVILDRLTALSADLGLQLTRSGDQAVFGAATP
jgi:poly-gamma-glutamate capsule biosynthesis protein CapA/YwtB (metallophosphatase superfamily)